ncbi:MAG TPA: PVC-type heme-binding CxxCH protein, partial [Verrucomicrobiae bacterium]|nr:PVC-type heme-binding CxxCH protein [Verrucomicrobiae bacterium]
MKPVFAPASSAFGVLLVSAGMSAVTGHSAEFSLDGQTFTVPDGFVVERVATPLLTERPITFDFDEQGRMYVAESSGSNDPVQKQLADKPHSILRLEDTDHDGVFDRRTVFADQMMFPAGTMWLNGSLYVTAPPEIWKLTDTDDDGVADQREVWFNPGTLTGCANDLHGPYLGLDGWVYWCKGAFAKQELPLTTGGTFTTRAAHIFRRHPDGGGVEPVMTGGMDNPVEVAFSPGGERFFSSTFVQHPGGGRRDGLIHAVYGGTYGKIHGVIDEHPRTGDILPVLTQLGPAAACALMRYHSDAFGPDYQDNLFASSFNLHKITRHRLVPEGATYQTLDEDFLVSDNPDFHPTHIVEDADGSLIVANTGGWYKLCCPTSQLYKPDVVGGLYRIRRAGTTPANDPRGAALDWNGVTPAVLASRLGDERVFVNRRAVDTLGRGGKAAVPALVKTRSSSKNSNARVAAVWALTRIEDPSARLAVVDALNDSDDTVRLAALQSISLWRDSQAVPRLVAILKTDSPHHRRVAAEALGRIGDSSVVPALLAAAADPVDRILEHSLTYALIEINDATATRPGLASNDSHTRRVALIALDQMPGDHLPAADVVALLTSGDPLLRETADWIVSRHADWGAALAGFFQSQLSAPPGTDEQQQSLARQIAKFTGDDAVQTIITASLQSPNAAARTIGLQAIAEARVKSIPEDWSPAIATLLKNRSPDLELAVTTAGALPLKNGKDDLIIASLKQVAGDEVVSPAIRLSALMALPPGSLEVGDRLFGFLTGMLASDQPVANRSAAAGVLASARLTSSQLIELTGTIQTAGPLEVNRLLAAYEKQTDAAVGLKLVEALLQADSRGSLRVEAIQPRLASFPDPVKDRANALYAMLNQDADNQRAHIDELLGSLGDGDIRRGQALFNSPTLACSSCHAI